MSGSQTDNGRAFEYAVGFMLSRILDVEIEITKESEKCRASYNKMTPNVQNHMGTEAKKAISKIIECEKKLLSSKDKKIF